MVDNAHDLDIQIRLKSGAVFSYKPQVAHLEEDEWRCAARCLVERIGFGLIAQKGDEHLHVKTAIVTVNGRTIRLLSGAIQDIAKEIGEPHRNGVLLYLHQPNVEKAVALAAEKIKRVKPSPT